MQNIDKFLEECNLVDKKEEILKAAASSIGIKKEKANEEDIPIGSSKFGGLPDLPPNFLFPKYDNGYLSFLAQLNLQEAKAFDKNNLLPQKGILFFFYDILEQPWGMGEEDKGCFKVLYYDGDVKELKRTPYPEETEDYFPLPSFKIMFKEFLSFPEELEGVELNEEEMENYYEFRDSVMQTSEIINNDEEMIVQPMHYMLGEPFNVQNNVFKEIIYYENEEKIDWPSEELNQKSNDLILLFQMDSDDDLDVMWGDVGILYFCIDKHDLQNKKFDQTKFILQCH
ncbi:YwqG family protein [Heyndrickxia sp. NPDC080065]|uniref:YwqG family protein n=1 Tax=Heyndrickxia sp. NPDC080065 TaxID=3390568 RepID=UPI003D076F17